MKQNKNLNRIILGGTLILAGFVGGTLVDDVPFVAFKREIDAGTLLSLFGLIAAIYIVPIIINSYLSKRDNTNQVIISDLDECLKKAEVVATLYKRLYLKEKQLDTTDMKELQSDLRNLTNCLDALAKQMDEYPNLRGFRGEVFNNYNENMYKDLTENTRAGINIDDQNYLRATASMNTTMSGIRRYRYLTYSN